MTKQKWYTVTEYRTETNAYSYRVKADDEQDAMDAVEDRGEGTFEGLETLDSCLDDVTGEVEKHDAHAPLEIHAAGILS
jgi:hypothetical protein